MPTVTIKIEIPEGFEREFARALCDVLRRIEAIALFKVAESLLEESKLTEKEAKEIAREIKRRIRERHEND